MNFKSDFEKNDEEAIFFIQKLNESPYIIEKMMNNFQKSNRSFVSKRLVEFFFSF